jgi:hypothetical protein
VRVRAVYVERSTGEMLLGPPKSRAGRRVVGIPGVIVPALREHLATFVACRWSLRLLSPLLSAAISRAMAGRDWTVRVLAAYQAEVVR